jgi:hypothetical protein
MTGGSERLAAYAPSFWMVVFDRSSTKWWIDRLAWGKWKHVSAIGYFADARVWAEVHPTLAGLSLRVWPRDGGPEAVLSHLTGAGRGVLHVRPGRGRMAPWRSWWCVPLVAGLVGLRSGALRPDALWRDLVAAGAVVVATGDEAADVAVQEAEA